MLFRSRALVAVADTQSYSGAARSIGVAQPTIYRAARELEARLGIPLFQTSANRVALTRAGERLSGGVRLTFAEIETALLEVFEAHSAAAGRIRIGALPLARATFLSKAVDLATSRRPAFKAHVSDGPYSDLLLALRFGALDVLLGALRDPLPARDVEQHVLFMDRLGVFCGPGHPLLSQDTVCREDLQRFCWVVPPIGTPTRSYFDDALSDVGTQTTNALVETSSMILVRELLQSNERLTLISSAQVAAEVRKGVLFEIPFRLNDKPRPIGLTIRKDWNPTDAQRDFVEALYDNNWTRPDTRY